MAALVNGQNLANVQNLVEMVLKIELEIVQVLHRSTVEKTVRV